MTITATCGHKTPAVHGIVVKGYTREGKRCLDSIVVCQECYFMYRAASDILDNEAEEQAWVRYEEERR